jgi:hypothetical protein
MQTYTLNTYLCSLIETGWLGTPDRQAGTITARKVYRCGEIPSPAERCRENKNKPEDPGFVPQPEGGHQLKGFTLKSKLFANAILHFFLKSYRPMNVYTFGIRSHDP